MATYKKSILEYDDVRSAVDYVREEGVEYGIQKGREEGREEGIEYGIQKGREEGRVEGVEYGTQKGREEGILSIALTCLKRGMSIEEISQITKLSEEEILKLKNESVD